MHNFTHLQKNKIKTSIDSPERERENASITHQGGHKKHYTKVDLSFLEILTNLKISVMFSRSLEFLISLSFKRYFLYIFGYASIPINLNFSM